MTNTFLPGMKLGLDKKSGLNRYITSWRSKDDPSPGNFSFRVDPNGSPQFFLYQGSNPVWRTGPWVGQKWSGVPDMTRAYIFNYSFISDMKEVSVTYTVLNDNIITIFLVDGVSGTVQRRTWHENSKSWVQFWYKPKSPRDWFLRDGSQGCVREENRSMCNNKEGFLKLASVKLPDTSKAWVNKSMTVKEYEEKRESLDWGKRFDIIMGIARGMLYLHQDSRLRIIHRDLKTSNILLDKDMIPKISDFGMARIFGNEQVQVNTTRVVGTYGYMAPEYALEGLMSVKSDVFSFGVLLLEVVTGRKNSGFYPDNPSLNLVGHVWELWKESRTLEIVDPYLKDGDNEEELLISLQTGLLCVQERSDDRPTMSAVVFMLSNKVELPSPNQPAFVHKGNHSDADPSSSSAGAYSINDLSFTAMVDGR
ncbi:Receptor-like serine/threonine-protein kinase SD1-7 [Bienertia sinuspersici]